VVARTPVVTGCGPVVPGCEAVVLPASVVSECIDQLVASVSEDRTY
jgi:hypothetical protein